MTIKSDTRQHSQLLQCLFLKTAIKVPVIEGCNIEEVKVKCNWPIANCHRHSRLQTHDDIALDILKQKYSDIKISPFCCVFGSLLEVAYFRCGEIFM